MKRWPQRSDVPGGRHGSLSAVTLLLPKGGVQNNALTVWACDRHTHRCLLGQSAKIIQLHISLLTAVTHVSTIQIKLQSHYYLDFFLHRSGLSCLYSSHSQYALTTLLLMWLSSEKCYLLYCVGAARHQTWIKNRFVSHHRKNNATNFFQVV